MPILSWTNAGNAGYPIFSNGKWFILPDPCGSTLPFELATNEVLYQKPGVCSHNMWVAHLRTKGNSMHDPPQPGLCEGQKLKDDVPLPQPGPSQLSRKNPRRAAIQSIKVLLSPKVAGNKRKLEDDPGMWGIFLHAVYADGMKMTCYMNHNPLSGKFLQKLWLRNHHLRLFLKLHGRWGNKSQ